MSYTIIIYYVIYNIYVHTTDANRPKKKDQVLKTFVYCIAMLSIKH